MLESARDKIDKALEHVRGQFFGISDTVLDSGFIKTIRVNVYNQSSEIGHVAQVTSDNKQILISLYDASICSITESALTALGHKAYKRSKQEIIVSIPSRSGDERQRICDHLSKLAEEAKISIRNIRKNCRQELDRSVTNKDELKGLQTDLQDVVDKAISEVEELVKNKISVIHG